MCGKLLASIREQHTFKIDVYPKTLAAAYEMLASHTVQSHSSNNKSTKENKNNSTNSQSSTPRNKTAVNREEQPEVSYLQSELVPYPVLTVKRYHT